MGGKLIVFEGTDGSGKATQTKLLCQELDRRGIPYKKLEFPRYAEDSSALIRLYLSGAFGAKADCFGNSKNKFCNRRALSYICRKNLLPL